MLFAGKTTQRLCAQASIYILKEYVTIVVVCLKFVLVVFFFQPIQFFGISPFFKNQFIIFLTSFFCNKNYHKFLSPRSSPISNTPLPAPQTVVDFPPTLYQLCSL